MYYISYEINQKRGNFHLPVWETEALAIVHHEVMQHPIFIKYKNIPHRNSYLDIITDVLESNSRQSIENNT